MESYPEAPVPTGGVVQPESLHLPILKAATLLGDSSGSDGFSEVLLDQYTEVDVSSEWLSSFVEECLSSAGNCLMPPKDHQTPTTTTTSKTPLQEVKPSNKNNKSPISKRIGIPAKPRGQRKRKATSSSKTHKNPLTKWSQQLKQRSTALQSAFFDPPLLEQTYWLADSELLNMPRKEEEEEEEEKVVEEEEEERSQQQQPRRCGHCQAQKTPQWRAGPMGPKTLCNACGMRYFKSGGLLPEYRPAKSPTFVSFKHSNSHKKVIQMRMALLSPSTSAEQ